MPEPPTRWLQGLGQWSPAVFFLTGIGFHSAHMGFFLDIWAPFVDFQAFIIWYVLLALGLLGFYDWPRSETPNLAFVGLLLTGIAAIAFAVSVVPTIAARITGTPFGNSTPPWYSHSFDLMVLATALGALSYGLGSIRGRAPSRMVGVLLIIVGTSIVGLFGFSGFVEASPKDSIRTASFLSLSLVFFVLGIVLRSHKPPTETIGYYDESPRAEATDNGWTNGFVRSGFEVDGSESRTSPIGMSTRLAVNRFLYEGSGVVFLRIGMSLYRAVYPAIRMAGRMVGRESGAEQYIAEQEYVIHHLENHDREGLSSMQGITSLALQLGIFVVPFIVGALAGTGLS